MMVTTWSSSQAVIDALALPPGLDQICIAQQAQLVGNRRLGHAQGLGEVIDAQLLLQQSGDDAPDGYCPKRS